MQPVVCLALGRDHTAVESQPLLEYRNLKHAPEPIAVLLRQFTLLAAREAHDKMPQPRYLLASGLNCGRQRAQNAYRRGYGACAELLQPLAPIVRCEFDSRRRFEALHQD